MIAAFVAVVVGGMVALSTLPGQAQEPAPAAAASTVTNPLVADGADPWMEFYQGNYYLAYTTWSSQLAMRKSPTIAGLATARPVVIWSDTTPQRCCNFWAPEFHLIKGPDGPRWYLTFTAGTNGTFDRQHTQVLESAGTDPMGPYGFKGRVFDRTHDTWAIDGSYLELNDKLYHLWSAWDGPDQNLYIAAMSNPWTISGPRTLLSTPTHDWETAGRRVNEAPVVLQRGGRTFVIYSASFCETPDYKLGQLTFTGGDPLATSSWSKSPAPIFTRNDGGKAFGPGHNGFFTSPDGSEDWIVYHANPSAADKCGRNRSTRVQKVSWNADGTPDLGTPVALGAALAVPSGEDGPITAPVRGAAYTIVNKFSGKCLETTLGVLNRNANVAQHTCAAAAPRQQWVLDHTGDGAYRLVNKNSRQALTAAGCATDDGTNVAQSPWRTGACQRWNVLAAGDGWVHIDDANSDKTLDVEQCFTAEDVNVRLWTRLDNDCQRWRLTPVGDVGISNVNNGKVLAAGCSAGDPAGVTMRAYDPGGCQAWRFVPAGGADYAITSADGGRCLGIAGGSTADGATADRRACTGDPAADQKWYLEPQKDGTLRFVNRGSGKNLDVAYCGLAEGTTVGQYPWFDNDCQRFRVVTVGPQVDPEPAGPTYPNPLPVSGDVEKVHDPSMIKKSDGTYLLVSTGAGLDIRTSADGRTFTKVGKVFPDGTPWADPYLPKVKPGQNRWLWAPDISVHNGRYYLYYSASSFGSRHSAIFLATSPTGKPGTWTHVGRVIETAETSQYNAIDPNLVVDAEGGWWLAFGSFWTGIKMVRIDPRTGLRDAARPQVHSLAGRPDLPRDNAIEAPYVYRHGDHYYLFVSYDWCCKGTSSTYRTMVGRSKHPNGPYVDRNGKPMTEGGATQLLAGHDAIPGPGHQAVLRDGDSDVLVYHYYWDDDQKNTGVLGRNTLEWDADGWPVVSAAEPVPGPGPSEPTPGPTSSATAGPAAGPAPSATAGPGGPGGGLPTTGARIGLMAAFGAVILAAGAALLLITRRRRSRFVSDTE